MKYAHVYALFLVFVFHTSCGQNQTNSPKDNTSQGYSENQLKEAVTSRVPIGMVRNVKQARNGDILIASWLAVFRYDGTSFTNLTGKIISPRFSSFWDVLEDREGNLWFGTRDSGVYRYNGKSFQHFTKKDGLASNLALHIYEDKAGNIWVEASRYDARLSARMNRSDGNDAVGQGKSFRNFTTKDGFPSNDIRLILEDKTGKFWFGTRDNIFVYDARLNGEVGQGKTFTVLKNKDGKAFKNVWSIIEDKKGSIWIGDVEGLWRYDGSTITKVSQRGASAMIEDKKGNIWTTGPVNPPDGKVWALSRYDQKSLYDEQPTVTEITSIEGPGMLCGLVEASDGSIWYGALGSTSGVFRYDGKTITDFKSKEGH